MFMLEAVIPGGATEAATISSPAGALADHAPRLPMLLLTELLLCSTKPCPEDGQTLPLVITDPPGGKRAENTPSLG